MHWNYNDCLPYDNGGDGPGPGTKCDPKTDPRCPPIGTIDNPARCPDTVYPKNKTAQVFDRYTYVSAVSGWVALDYFVGAGSTVIFEIWYNGVLQAERNITGQATGTFGFDYAPTATDVHPGIVGVRVTSSAPGAEWQYTLRCSNPAGEDDCVGEECDEGGGEHPAPCRGTYDSRLGGGAGVHDMIHDMGTVAGSVRIDYQMWNISDSMDVYYRGALIATTGGYVTGVGHLTFNFVPVNNVPFLTVRITSNVGDTVWNYMISCPGDDGFEDDPKNCEPDSAHPVSQTFSGGAGTTDTYYTLGSLAGTVRIRYQTWYVPDTITIYQGSTLVATTGGPVAKDDYLVFNYNPALGNKIRIRVVGSGYTTWVFLVECPFDSPKVSVNSPSGDEGSQISWTIALDDATKTATRDIVVTYHLTNVSASAADYTATTTGTATIPVGAKSVTVNLSAASDSLVEGNETVNLVIDSITNGEVGTQGTGVLTINDVVSQLACGTQLYTKDGPGSLTVTMSGVNNGFAYFEYRTVASTITVPGGAPNDIRVTSLTGTLLDATPAPQLRWDDWGYGGMVIPVSTATTGLIVSSPTTSYWKVYSYCPIVWGGTSYLRSFDRDFPRVQETGDYLQNDIGPSGAKAISLGADTLMNGPSMWAAFAMMRTRTGSITIRGFVDDIAQVYFFKDGDSTPTIMPGQLLISSTQTINMTLAANTTYFVMVLVENTPVGSTPCMFNMSVRDSSGEYILITSKDWKGAYYEATSYPNNEFMFVRGNALIFDTEAECTAYRNSVGAPSMQDIFNTWPRSEDSAYYASVSAAQGYSADWYYDSPTNAFVQPNNVVASPNCILSPATYSNYVLEATLASSNSDDDAIGLVMAFAREGSTNYILAALRTQGGLTPAQGYGIVVYTNSTAAVITQNTVGAISRAWSGAQSRVRIERVGDVFTVKVSNWNATGSWAYTETLDLNSNASLARFKGAKQFGFHNHSQAMSTYLNVNMPMSENWVFCAANNHAWEAVGGAWVDRGTATTIGTRLGWPGIFHNTSNNRDYYVYKNVNRRKT
jgi:hypothetical protein